MAEPESEIEKNYLYNKQELVGFLDDLKNQIEAGRIKIWQEHVEIPDGSMDIEFGFKIEKGQKEIEIEIKWQK